MKLIRVCLVLVLLVAACGGSSASSTTTTEAEASTTEAEGSAATTTAAAPSATTTTQAPDTTTTTEPPAGGGDAMERAQAKVDAVAAAAPDGWTTTIEPADEFEPEQDIVYESCLIEGEFDIDNLDEFSEVALVASVVGPTPQGSFFPPGRASIEARVMESAAVAEEAFAVFARLYGSEEGVDCVMEQITAELGDEMPTDEFSFEVSEQLLDDADAGAQFSMLFEVEGFEGAVTIEFQGTLDGDTTVIGTFFSFGEPIDPDIANALFSAAVNA